MGCNEDELDANETLAGGIGSKVTQVELETAEAEWRTRRRQWKTEQWQRKRKEIFEHNGSQQTERNPNSKPAWPKVPQGSTTQAKYHCAFCPNCFTKRRFLISHLKAHSALAHDPRFVMVSDSELNQFSHKLMTESKLQVGQYDAASSYPPEPVGNVQVFSAPPAIAVYTPITPLTLNVAPSDSAELSTPVYTPLTYAPPSPPTYAFPSFTVSSAFPGPLALNSGIAHSVIDYPLTWNPMPCACAMGQVAIAHTTGQQTYLPAPTPSILHREQSDRDDAIGLEVTATDPSASSGRNQQ